ncbi:MAG: phosphopentomutase [Oligoflexia bacterium]|nr:phosphopentomutase [Oligoflexia bacterium]
MTAQFDRVILIVLDGVGAGELPDATVYGDRNSNTLGNLSRSFKSSEGRTLSLPNLAAWGLGNITSMEGISGCQPGNGEGAFGRALELSRGKDTTSGHWEMAGLVVNQPFATYPQGFPKEIVDRWVKENDLPGVLGNCAASGTEIIVQYGEEHMRTGKPILYTSADSVWQVAAHEQAFGLERLYKICKSARIIGDELKLGRIIARPFVGDPSKGVPFKRTYNRKDYAQLPSQPTYLDHLRSASIPVLGIGKISNIYAGQGIDKNIDTAGNTDGIKVLLEQLKQQKKGLIFCNLIDFDMLYGHRRDVKGFALALEEFDRAIPEIKKRLTARDLILISADHGNDPTFHGTDHTREYIPILAYSPAQKSPTPVDLGIRNSFADIGATAAQALLGQATPTPLAGVSFLKELGFSQ